MLRLSDSRNFSRTLAAIGLLAGPLLFAIGGLLDPAWDDDAATYLAEVADAKGRYIAAGVLGSIGAILMVFGMLGVARLFRGRRVTLGQVGATMIAIGLMGLAAVVAFNGMDIVLAEADNREAAAQIFDDGEDSVALIVWWTSFFVGGIMLGSLVLAIALFRRRGRDLVPIWSPILLIVSMVLGFMGESSAMTAISFVVLLAALVPLAMVMWNLSDDDWEHWELPVERGEAAPVETPAAPPQPATPL